MSQEQPSGGAADRPQGTIRLTVQGSTFTSGLTPTVHVGGHRVNTRWGVQDVPVWAGPTRVEAYSQWMRRFGEAALDVDVPPGAVVPVFYAVPWHQFSRGAMGHVRQARPGVLGFVALMAAIVGLPLLLVVAGVVAG